MGGSAWIGLTMREWATGAHIRSVAGLFFLSGLLAYPLAILPAGWLAKRWATERRFALAFVVLLTMTVGMTAFLFAMQYRLYYSEWHDDHLSVRWAFEFAFTTLAAIYQFAVMGMPLFMPVGLAALFGAGLWFAKRAD